MNSQNILLAVDLLLQLTAAAERVAVLVRRAQSEGRDVTPEDLQGLRIEDNLARDRLLVAIEAAEKRAIGG